MTKPLVVYDGHCGFCKIWIDYTKRLIGDAVEYSPYQELGPEFKKAVHLIFPNGEIVQGAEAVFRVLAFAPGKKLPLWLYKNMPGFAPVTELLYRIIAAHRDFGYKATALLFGKEVYPQQFNAVAWLFEKSLALVYLSAFISFAVQATALIGSDGVSPIGLYLARASQALGASAWLQVPTLLWIAHSNTALHVLCWAGICSSIALLCGAVPRLMAVFLYILYLSIVAAGQEFMSFQWDMLLLEAGFLATFLGSSKRIVWLYRMLLFRLMLMSGTVKLLSGDPTWHNLTALNFHYQTQPLPTPIAWYAQHFPEWFQRFSVASVFTIEILIPFLIFAPRRLRHFAAWSLILLQICILITGNYAFFNWLALAFCLFLFDDRALTKIIPARPRKTAVPAVIFGIILLFGFAELYDNFMRRPLPVVSTLMGFTAPFGIVNGYGLFAIMTTQRLEIIIEGSNDGVTWLAYEFPYKPGDVRRRPPWVAPYQPRLDWQMWFAALGNYRENPWFVSLVARLLHGSPDVLKLFAYNPFPEKPPVRIRAVVYEYKFTDSETRRKTGAWWTREPLGRYIPSITLDDLQK
jgi:lipase maturation factor 1